MPMFPSLFTVLFALLLAGCGDSRVASRVHGGIGRDSRVVAPLVGPGGSPKARGLPSRTKAEPVAPVLRVSLAWETPREPKGLGSISYAWTAKQLVRCARTAAKGATPGSIEVVVARPVNGQTQRAELSFASDLLGNEKGNGRLALSLPRGIAVRAEGGDTLASDANVQDADRFEVSAEMRDGVLVGRFAGRLEGRRTGEGYAATGDFQCPLAE